MKQTTNSPTSPQTDISVAPKPVLIPRNIENTTKSDLNVVRDRNSKSEKIETTNSKNENENENALVKNESQDKDKMSEKKIEIKLTEEKELPVVPFKPTSLAMRFSLKQKQLEEISTSSNSDDAKSEEDDSPTSSTVSTEDNLELKEPIRRPSYMKRSNTSNKGSIENIEETYTALKSQNTEKK